MTPTVLGSIVSLWRYPVKSMLGEELNAAEITKRGLLGDRAYARTSEATSAGSWRSQPSRRRCPRLNQLFSKVLKREVKLSALPDVRTATAEEYWPDIEGLDHRDTVTDFGLPEGTFFDCTVVHLLTTATLDRLRALYPQGRFEVRRFRPNIVVETADGKTDFVENAWIGQVLAIGDSVRLSVTGPCPRCVMTTLAQGDLPKDTGILRAAAQHNRANVGIYASVLEGGTVRRGDSVRLESAHA